jgi:hypothetical protein
MSGRQRRTFMIYKVNTGAQGVKLSC